MTDAPVEFDDVSGEEEEGPSRQTNYSDAVVHATDWTTETIIAQLRRKNISLTPRFQRRDAWSVQQKSRFIESLVMGLPVPQIVLAEVPGERGKYLVLDGKQRLLSLLQYWGLGEGRKNRYALSGLKVLTHLNRRRLSDLESEPTLSSEFNALLNQTIRTVVIRNWPDTDFLHLVFLRLNTGSTKLSPQELRQALQPGPFTDWVDEQASRSAHLKQLLGLSEPDFRMRDTEVLARFIAFRFYLEDYPGRMKRFLDDSFEKLNVRWGDLEEADGASALEAQQTVAVFEHSIEALIDVFASAEAVARRPGSRFLNRTLLDMLLVYAQDDSVREAMRSSPNAVRRAYASLFEDSDFVSAIESDTASTASTALRLRSWAHALNTELGLDIPLPEAQKTPSGERIRTAKA